MPPAVGDDEHIKGFILNKLYEGHYFGRSGARRHGRHTSVDNLPKGYEPKFRGKFPRIVGEMKKGSTELIIVFPSTGGEHVCANLDQVERGLEICNRYRQSVGLHLLDRSFREVHL